MQNKNKNNTIHIAILYILCIINILVSLSIITPITNSNDTTIPESTTTIQTGSIPDETTPYTVSDFVEETTVETTVEEPTIEPTEETEPEIDNDILEMLACVIYQEAGGDHQCDMCRRRVADVVLNRVTDSRFPNTIYEVLTQENQYGSFHWTGIVWPSRATNPYEKHAVERAYRIAREVLSGEHSELYGRGYIWQATFVQGEDNVYCCGHYYGR